MLNGLFYGAKAIEFHGVDISPKAIKMVKKYEEKIEFRNCFLQLWVHKY